MSSKINSLLLLVILMITSCSKSSESDVADQFFKQGSYEKAIASYDSFLKLEPHNIKSIYNRGRAYEELGRFEEAVSDYERVLEIDPENISANLSIGKNYYRNKEYDKASLFFDKVTKSDSENAVAHFLRGRALSKMGLLKEAMESYNNAININKDYGDAYFSRATLYRYLKRNKKACSDFKLAHALGLKEAQTALDRYCK